MTEHIDQDLRVRLDQLISKARSDDTFAFALRTDTEATLQAEGFDGSLLATLASEFGDDDTAGYAPRLPDCDPWTCIITRCRYWTN